MATAAEQALGHRLAVTEDGRVLLLLDEAVEATGPRLKLALADRLGSPTSS